MRMDTRFVLFDLGGVLIDISGIEEFGKMTGETHSPALTRKWLSCPWVRRFESGRCTRTEFAAGMVERYDIPLSPNEFLARFRAWPAGLFPDAKNLIDDLAPHVGSACFSNTNELHWSDQGSACGLDTMFETRFLSYEIGLVKPDPDAFEFVVSALGAAPGEILFLDDNALNVDGARAVGIDAVQVMRPSGARALLESRGLIRNASR